MTAAVTRYVAHPRLAVPTRYLRQSCSLIKRIIFLLLISRRHVLGNQVRSDRPWGLGALCLRVLRDILLRRPIDVMSWDGMLERPIRYANWSLGHGTAPEGQEQEHSRDGHQVNKLRRRGFG